MAEIIGRRQWFNVPVPDIIGRIKGDINYGRGAVEKGTKLLMKFWGEKGEASYPWKSLDTLVRHREHPLGQVRADDRHQGAGRQDQPLGSVDRGGQGARPRRLPDRRQPRREKFFDGKMFDPADPAAYLKSLAIKRAMA